MKFSGSIQKFLLGVMTLAAVGATASRPALAADDAAPGGGNDAASAKLDGCIKEAIETALPGAEVKTRVYYNKETNEAELKTYQADASPVPFHFVGIDVAQEDGKLVIKAQHDGTVEDDGGASQRKAVINVDAKAEGLPGTLMEIAGGAFRQEGKPSTVTPEQQQETTNMALKMLGSLRSCMAKPG